MKVGDKIANGENAEIRPGNALYIRDIPVGTQIHNIELLPGEGGQMARSAGVSAQLLAKEGVYCSGSPAQRRSPARSRALHGDDWSGWQYRSRQHQAR